MEFIVGFIIGINCFMAGYQYRGYRENRFRRESMRDLLKRIEEDDYQLLKGTADKIMRRVK
jgi:5-methylthioribose kinase